MSPRIVMTCDLRIGRNGDRAALRRHLIWLLNQSDCEMFFIIQVDQWSAFGDILDLLPPCGISRFQIEPTDAVTGLTWRKALSS